MRLLKKRGASAAAALYAAIADLADEWKGDPDGEIRRDRVKRRLRLAARLAARLAEGGAEPGKQTELRKPVVSALRELAVVVDGCGEEEREHIRSALERAAPLIASGGWDAARKPLTEAVAVTRPPGGAPTKEPTSLPRKTAAAVAAFVVTYAVVLAAKLAPLGFDYALDTASAYLGGQRPPAAVVEIARSTLDIVVWVFALGALTGVANRFRDSIPGLAAIIDKVTALFGRRRDAAESDAAQPAAASEASQNADTQ